MSTPNGHAEDSRGNQFDKELPARAGAIESTTPSQFAREQVKRFVDLLEVPFDGSVIEWRVTNTSKRNGNLRGQVIPYADQRAYTDRLNALFTPAGWTRKYTIHTTSNFQRDEDQKLVAKVFVTWEVTIFGLGSHSATGEEWTDDENAVTSAEAQAFKRACSCFGLGRYLYCFSGIWTDLDERKRPLATPTLVGWATPGGWAKGLRPDALATDHSGRAENVTAVEETGNENAGAYGRSDLIRQIEAMSEPLGKRLYRGLLKTLARAWNPSEIHDMALLQKTLASMKSAERGLERLRVVVEVAGSESLNATLRALNLRSLAEIQDLKTLHQLVVTLEEQAAAMNGSRKGMGYGD